jgi:hypothetical protein
MISSADSRLEALVPPKSLCFSEQQTDFEMNTYTNSVIGAAIFDLSGLPKEFFATTTNEDASWVQAIFQALGLQLLLTSSLRLEGFRHAIVRGSDYWAVVVKQKSQYTALLVNQQKFEGTPESFLDWSQKFEPSSLRNCPGFKVI